MNKPNPKHHTAEHILHGIVQNDFGGKIIRLNFKGKKTRCDFQVNLGNISLDAFREHLQFETNKIISQNLPVTFEEVDIKEAKKKCKTIHRLPEDINKVRLSKIGNIIIPCVGDHVSNTKEIGKIEIRTVNKIDENLVRLTFILH